MRKYILFIVFLLLIPVYLWATDGVSTVEHPAKVNSVATPDKVCGVSGLAAGGGATNYLLDAHCMAAFYMNANTGAETERSGNGTNLSENGTIPTSATVPSGYSGASRDFEVDDTERLYQADGLSTDIGGDNQSMSVCVWIKIEDDSAADNTFLKKYETAGDDRQYIFKFDDADDAIEVSLGHTSGASYQKAQGNTNRATLSTDWHHHCFVYNDTDIRIYLDGVLDTNTSTDVCVGGDNPCAYTAGIYSGGAAVAVGADTANNGGVDGLMDELIIFDDALSAAEVLEIYQNGIDGGKGGSD